MSRDLFTAIAGPKKTNIGKDSNNWDEYVVHPNGIYQTNIKGEPGPNKIPAGAYLGYLGQKGEALLIPKAIETDALITLPDMATKTVLDDLSVFWKQESKQKFDTLGMVYKRGILMFGEPGCHAKDTEILMYDGSIKKVQDVVVGEMLMGPDSKPREVLQLARNRQEMVKINPTKGESFIVNRDHILHLTRSGKVGKKSPINIKFNDFIKESKCFQNRYKLTRTSVDFQQKELKIPAYILGAWLGDGTSSKTGTTSMDNEIIREWYSYSNELNLEIRIEYKKVGKAHTYNIHQPNKMKTNSRQENGNKFLYALNDYNLIKNKHIPKDYLISSREQRLDLLAGLIDTDGHYSTNGYSIVQKSKKLANDILFLSRSLGFAAYIKEVKKKCYNSPTQAVGTYYKVQISGDCSIVPVKLERKKAAPRKQVKNVLRTGFTYELLPEDDYYGFSLNNDHLYLTGDFTIHHNTGKSACVIKLAESIIKDDGIVLFNPNPNCINDIVKQVRSIEGEDRKVLVILEEVETMCDDSGFLSLLDGEMQVNNIAYVATTNYIDKIPKRIKNRPSRFARVIEIAKPSYADRLVYISNKLNSLYPSNYHKELAKATDNMVLDQVKDVIISTYIFNISLKDSIAKISDMKDEYKDEAVEEKDSVTGLSDEQVNFLYDKGAV